MNIVIYGIIGTSAILFFLVIILIILLLNRKQKEVPVKESIEELPRCPTCGQILEPEWNRCPFCTDDNIITFQSRKQTDKEKKMVTGFLVLIDDNDKIFKIEKDIIYIGSDNSNDIKIKNEFVAPQHAKIWFNETKNRFYLEDLGSSNGTKVNNEYVNSIELRDGDIITIAGNRFAFKVLNKQ